MIPGSRRFSGEGTGYPLQYSWASLVAQMVKNPPAMQETWVSIPGLGRSPEGGHGNPLQYSCMENPHGQKSLAGYSPQGCKESDTTDRLSIALSENRQEIRAETKKIQDTKLIGTPLS